MQPYYLRDNNTSYGSTMERTSSDVTSNHHEVASEITDIIGQFGRWQKFYFGIMTYVCGVTAFPALSMTFLAPTVPFHCQADVNSTCYINNSVPCDSWQFDHTVYTSTLTEKFEFVCNRSWLVSLSNSINMAGDVTAALFLGHLADRFGRRPVIAGAVIPAIVANILILLPWKVEIFLLAKFLVGLAGFSAFTVGFVFLMEVVGEVQRPLLGIAVEFGWALAYVMLPGIAWGLHDWFNIQLVITCFICVLSLLWCLIPESPRWLLLHNKVDEAEIIVRKALRWNKIKMNNEELTLKLKKMAAHLQESSKNQRHYTILDLFRTARLRNRTLVLAFYWSVNGFVFYGISLNSEIFGGNTFFNFFLFGLVEFPAYLLAIPVVHYAGRKWPLAIYMLGAGLACLLTITIPKDSHYAAVTLISIGKFFIASSFALIYPYTTEVYPTGVRTIGIGTCNLFARAATVLAPFVAQLSQASSLTVSMSIFGVLAVISGISVWLLPETKGKILPETLDDSEMLCERCPNLQMGRGGKVSSRQNIAPAFLTVS